MSKPTMNPFTGELYDSEQDRKTIYTSIEKHHRLSCLPFGLNIHLYFLKKYFLLHRSHISSLPPHY